MKFHSSESGTKRETIRFSTLLTTVLLLICVTGIVFAAGSAASILISRNEDVGDPFEEGNNYSYLSSITYSGRYIAFDSKSSNLDQDIPDAYTSWDIFLADRGVPDGDGKFDDSTISIELISIQAVGSSGDSRYPMMPRKSGVDETTEGRYIVFQSYATFFDYDNWTPPDPPGAWLEQWDPGLNHRDIFLFDREEQYVYSISYPPDFRIGELSNANSGSPGNFPISLNNPVHAGAVIYLDDTNKPWVVFESQASNLIPGGTTTGRQHIYLREINEIEGSDGVTSLLSKNASGFEANGDSGHPAVSSDGRFVAFVSYATNLIPELVPLPDGIHAQIYLLDRDFGAPGVSKYYLLSSDVSGLIGNGDSFTPSIGETGAGNIRVSFNSDADNLIPGDTNGYPDVFVAEITPDSPGHTIARVSLSTDGEQGNNLSTAPTISGDGNVVSFTSYATNLIFNDSNFNCYDVTGQINCPDIFSRDLRSLANGATWRTSLTTDGNQSQANSGVTQLDGIGRYASFVTFARLISDGVQGPYQQIYVRDHGNPPGNPIISPTYWKFTGVQPGETSTRVITMSFIDTLEIGTIIMDPLQDNTRFSIISDGCSASTFNNGDSCTFTVQYDTTGEALGSAHYGRVIISLFDDTRDELYVGIEGRVSVVQYHPLVMSD